MYTAGFVLWATAVGFGLGKVWNYENGPGRGASAPATWPDDTITPRPRHRPTLVLLVHPQCSCSRATIAELAFVQKPFTPTTLVRRVRAALDSMPAGMVGAAPARAV